MNRKQTFRYMRNYIRDNKIKDGFMKRGVYAAMFDMPKKMEKSLKMAKNDNHKEYMIRSFIKLARTSKSQNIISMLS